MEKRPTLIDILMEKKRTILKKKLIDQDDTDEIERLDGEISEECSDKEYDKIVDILGGLENESGSTNTTNIWKQMKKAFPKQTKPLPTGVKNVEGKIITNP